jgi:hypothetical protein
MAFLKKKVFGLTLILLGGLSLVHGAVAGWVWEILVGLVLLAAGTALLVLKVVGRNPPIIGDAKR